MSGRTEVKRIGERVRNKTGRVDVLVSQLTDELVRQSGNPVLAVVHKSLMPTLVDPLLHYYLGPRNRIVRKISRVVKTTTGKARTGVRGARP